MAKEVTLAIKINRLARLKSLVEKRFGGGQTALAAATGFAKAQVNHWFTERRPIGDGVARQIELALGLPSGWLDHGDMVENVSHAPQGRLVPLISFVQAGGWGEIRSGEAERMMHARESTPGPNAFALRVEGDSMTSDGTPTFPEGTIIIVDPDRSPKPGDYVVARSGESATFKKLMTDGAAWYLRPLNRDYKPIEIDKPEKVVVGVVIEYWTGGKL